LTKLKFHQYAAGVLGFDVLVILWGAFVRATHSGAGCGSHWPDCNGEVIPFPNRIETVIEFVHRATSGLSLLLVAALCVWAFRALAKGHPARSAAAWSLIFTLGEALIGAALVLLELVGDNASVGRAFVMSAHLVNTFLLLAALALTTWFAATDRRLALRGQGPVGWGVFFGLASLIVLGVSGAIAALGATLFPATSLVEGLRQDLSPTAHFLVRLRLFHPLIAMSVGLYLILTAGLAAHLRPSPHLRRVANWVSVLVVVALAFGLVNLVFHAPVWMQLVHLLLADLLWIAFVIGAAEALAVGVPHVELNEPGAVEPAVGRATWRDYVALTKPRVISLLLFTTLTAMVIAAGGWPGTFLFVAVAVGGYLSAGAANAINMVIDRDIDGRMRRTARRPTVTRAIPSRHALVFAFALAAMSFALLWYAANMLTAMLAFAGLVCYVIVYTLLLKRRTWGNIVIGGAAGAFPPLVGWAAVTDDLSLLAWCLFGIIFVWTPVHFWALALLLKDDYAEAGVPMLPVVRGVRATVVQIAFYTVLTVALSAVPLALGDVGWLYSGTAVLLNGVLMLRSLQLYKQPDHPRAGSLFRYSMVYLALLFLAMAVDRTMWS
jgi:protoheme IX farnesyltransferase